MIALYIFKVSIDNFPAHMYVYCMRAWYPRRPEKGTGSPRTGVTVNYETPPCVLGTKLGSSARASAGLNC